MAKQRLNPRQEKFVREYAKTGVARKAYVKAGFKSAAPEAIDANASRLISSDKVKNAIVAHQLRTMTRHDYTVDTILNELEDGRQLAHATSQPGAAVSASIGKARLLGMIVDRKETGTPGEFAALDTVKAILEAARKELGNEAVIALARLIGEPVTIEATAEPSGEND